MLPLIELIATLAITLFAGAAIYVSFVEHPARMACSTEIAATVWAPSYRRATAMQAPLAAVGFLTGTAARLLGAGLPWLIAGLLIFCVIPVTVGIILPTNRRLLVPGRDLGSAETRELLTRWGRLHAIRTVLSFLASVVVVWQLVAA